MLVVAGFLRLYDFLYPPTPEAVAGAAGTSSSAVNSPLFGRANWLLPNGGEEEATIAPMRTYALVDLKTGADESTVGLRQYANDLGHALAPYSNPKLPSEALATMSAYEQATPESMLVLAEAKRGHEGVLADLLEVAVPTSIASYHLLLVNSVSRLDYLTGNMQLIETSPLIALTSARIFGGEVERLAKTLEALNGIFTTSRLKFSANDGPKIYLNVNR